MTDLTNIIGAEKQIPYALYGFGEPETYKVDVIEDGITAVDTYALVTLPKGRAFVGGKVVVCEDATSAGSATLKFTVGSFDVTSAIALANLKLGTVIDLNAGNAGACKSASADTQVKITVGGAAFTGLKFALVLETVDISTVG